jgi:NAD(P)-dependent dehydrogenase (short-subunit alcohol dehydrogenase family)
MPNSTALVTGAKGIGKEIARQLAAAGLTVYVGSRTIERGRRAVREIGGNARLLVVDVTDAASIADAAAQVEDVDVLVNNAGVMIDGRAATEADVDSFRRTYETNVFGVLAVTNALLPALRRPPHPRIVNVSSGTGSLGWSTGPNPQFAYQTGGARRRHQPHPRSSSTRDSTTQATSRGRSADPARVPTADLPTASAPESHHEGPVACGTNPP